MTDRFPEFWALYPRKVAKLAALKAWKAALKHDTADNIIAGLKRCAFSTDSKFIPHPSTWLNQGRWMDEPETGPAKPVQSDDQKAASDAFWMKVAREQARGGSYGGKVYEIPKHIKERLRSEH